MYLNQRTDLGYVSQGKLVTIENYYELFNGIIPPKQLEGLRLLDEAIGPDDADVREAMSGNLCRCGAYQNIVTAIQTVRGKR